MRITYTINIKCIRKLACFTVNPCIVFFKFSLFDVWFLTVVSNRVYMTNKVKYSWTMNCVHYSGYVIG